MLHQLQAAQSGLDQAAAGLEAQFLKTGSSLESLAEEGQQFIRQVESLIGLATGKGCDHSIFTDAISLVERTTNFLAGCELETSRMLDSLRDYNSQITRLLGTEVELQQAMLPLNIVQTLFRMESAPLGPEVQQMFGALTQEIESLHSQMREIFGTKFKQLEQTRQTIGLVIAKLEEEVASLQQVTRARKTQIDASLNTLKQEMLRNQDRDVRLDRFSHDVAREVQEIVMGLQFQDIVNQKLQHVHAALPQISDKLAQFDSAGRDSAAESMQFIRQSCRLEGAQLDSARQELAAAETTIRTGIEKVLSHVNEIDTRCLSLDEFTLLTTSSDGIVQVLIETIEEVRVVVGSTVANASDAYELLRPLGSLASDLTLIIRNMSGKIQLIGLNAQIKAAQAAQDGRGKGLEVLSARTREISEETNRIGEQAAASLDSLVGGLAHNVKAFEQLQARGKAQQTELNLQGRQYETQLHAIRDDALQVLRTIGVSLENLGQHAREALALVEFTQFHETTLPALQAPVQALGQAAEKWLDDRQHALSKQSLVESFKQNYTMNSERQVFDDVMAAEASLAPAAGSPPAPPAPALAATPSAAATAPAPIGAAPTAQDQPLNTLPPLAETAKTPDLGANVELF